MRLSASVGPPPSILPEANSTMKTRKRPAAAVPTVVIRATGPLRNVLNITPRPITKTICSQMPT